MQYFLISQVRRFGDILIWIFVTPRICQALIRIMRDKILKYANSQGLSINETGGGVYYISFNAKPNFKVTITVPFFVLEWSISIRTEDDNNEIFSESCEHNYGDKGETKFDEEMEEAVINTIKALNNADIRITKTTEAGWVDFWELTFSTFK
jgi:methionine synthase II (cobalamin-independent)